MSKCKSCGAQVVWVKLQPGGKAHPVDASTIDSRIVLNGDQTQGAIRKTGISHFATCPNAAKHRKT